MFKSMTSQSIAAVVAAGLVASFIALVMSGAPVAKAEPLIGGEARKAALERVNEGPCSLQSWPNYEQAADSICERLGTNAVSCGSSFFARPGRVAGAIE